MEIDLQRETPAAEERNPNVAARLRRLWLVFPFLVLLAVLAWAYTTNFIPSNSMLPTLRPGDHILTMRSWLAYPHDRMPDRGDIVTFIPPAAALRQSGDAPASSGDKLAAIRPEVWVKRVIGLPGETVAVFRSVIYINGEPLPTGVRPNQGLDPESDTSFSPPVVLGPDEVYVVGDNMADSDDSRHWGALKRRLIVGKFLRVIFNEGSQGLNERLEKRRSGG